MLEWINMSSKTLKKEKLSKKPEHKLHYLVKLYVVEGQINCHIPCLSYFPNELYGPDVFR